MTHYLRSLRAIPLLTPAAEAEVAIAIEQAHEGVWRAMLSYPPALAAVRAALDGDESATREVDELIDLASSTPARRRIPGYAAAARRAAARMCAADIDRIRQERVIRTLDLTAHRRPTGAELAALARRRGFAAYVARVHDAERIELRHKTTLATANLRLVVSVASPYRSSGLPLADLVQEGNIGLLKAVDRFDRRRGCKFSTFAVWWIRHAVALAAMETARTVRVPSTMITNKHRVERAHRALRATLGRPPSDPEIAHHTGMPLSTIATVTRYASTKVISLDTPPNDRAGPPPIETTAVDDGRSFANTLVVRICVRELAEHLDELSDRQADVLRKRYGLADGREWTLEEIGRTYGVTRERIRQIQSRAIAALRESIGWSA